MFSPPSDREAILKALQPTFTFSRPSPMHLAPEDTPMAAWRQNNHSPDIVVSNPTCAGLLIATEGSIQAFCSPRSPIQASRRADFLAGIVGNDLLTWSGGYIDKHDTRNLFIGMIRHSDAKRLKIPHDPQNLNEVFLTDKKDKHLYLHRPTCSAEDDYPVAALLHKVLPFRFHDEPPSCSLDAIPQDTLDRLGAISEYAGVVGEAIIFMAEHYSGLSIHGIQGFTYGLFTDSFSKLVRNYQDMDRMSLTIFTNLQPMFHFAPDHLPLKTEVEDILRSCVLRYQLAHPTTPTATTPPPVPTPTTITPATPEPTASNTNVFPKNFIRVLTMSNPSLDPLALDGDFSLPTTLPAIIEPVISSNKQALNVLQFNEQLEASNRRLQSAHSILYNDISKIPFNKAGIMLLRNCTWATDPWTQLMTTDASHLSIFSFGPPNDLIKKIQANIFATQMDDFLDQAREHRTPISTKPFVNFEIKSWADLTCTLQTLNAFIIAISNYDPIHNPTNKPWFSAVLEAIISLVTDVPTRRWGQAASNRLPHIPYQICFSTGIMLSAMCKLAADPEINDSATLNKPPSTAHERVREVQIQLSNILTQIRNDVVSHSTSGFANSAPLSYVIHCPTNKFDKQKRQLDYSNKSSTPEERPTKTTRHSDPNKGFLLHPDSTTSFQLREHRPPPMTWKHKTAQVCLNFVTKGKTCSFANCKFHHIPSPDELFSCSPDQASAFVEFVSKHPNIHFDSSVNVPKKFMPLNANNNQKNKNSTPPSKTSETQEPANGEQKQKKKSP